MSMPTFIAGRAADNASWQRRTIFRLLAYPSAGLTLIELMVGMAIIGIILSVAVAGLRSVTDAELKSVSSRLGSTIRYLYNKSATERLYLRIVYDFDDNAYHVEAASEPFVISPPASEEEKETKKEKESPSDEEEQPVVEHFTAAESYLLKSVKLGENVFFKDIQVDYAKEKIAAGQAYTYFFPNGFATPTMINLRDYDDETYYSLKVLPLSGRVEIESDYRNFYETEKE